MQNINAIFINILKASLKGDKVNLSKIALEDLKKIYNLALKHNVESLIYSGINNDDIEQEKKSIMETLKKMTFLSAIYQIRQMNIIEDVFHEMRYRNINYIALKGIQVREMYNHPEYRTMSDIDILVNNNDLNTMDILLKEYGYKRGEAISNHVVYRKEKCLDIEVHWTIKNNTNKKYLDNIVKEMWDNTLEFSLGKERVIGLNYEYLLLYLLIHIQVHLSENGFGVRQLCDICQVINKKYDQINWIYFEEIVNKYKMQRFSKKIFYICNKFLDMKMPTGFKVQDYNSDPMILELINQIIIWGVHGDKKYDGAVDKLVFYNTDTKASEFKYMINFLFPKRDKLNKKYEYAKKHKITLPIAWVHRWINIILSRKISIRNNKCNLKQIYKESQEKVKILNWLNN